LKARSTRMLLLVLLVLALPPGAAVAACLQSGPDACCCTQTCPKPDEARLDKMSCCEMSEDAALPSTVPAMAAPVPTKSFADAGDRIDPFVEPVVSDEAITEVKPVRGLPRPVPLFTMHAAFLI